MPGERAVHVGLITLDLLIPGSRSLKEKRSVLRGLIDRVRSRLHVGIAEVGCMDQHRRAIVCAAAVGNERAVVERVLDQVRAYAERRDGAELQDWWIEWR